MEVEGVLQNKESTERNKPKMVTTFYETDYVVTASTILAKLAPQASRPL